MLYLTRRERFNAAHRMFRPDWDDQENMAVYGKCSNPNWHGHNYTLFVTVKGNINPENGLVINLKTLSALIRDRIIEKIDHKNINVEVEFMKGLIASSENLVVAIWNELEQAVRDQGALLYRIRLEESENNFIEYYGTNAGFVFQQ